MKRINQNLRQKRINSIFYFLNSKFSVAILFSIFYFLFSFASTEAAKLNLTSQTQEIAVGQQFQVDLILDTEGEIINAIEGEIIFPKELLEIKEIRDGDSIVNLWVERPSIKPTDTVIFSGVIPTGFEGVLSPYYEGYRPGKVFSLIFVSKEEGEGSVNFENGKVLLHDGLGTPAKVKISNFQFSISKQIIDSTFYFLDSKKDTDPPEDFKPEIAQSPEIFEGKWFLVFLTQDKGSGIDHYEIQENRRQKIENRRWIEAESPYLLKDQALKSYIYVKAVDKAGNERITTLPPRYPLAWYENYLIWVKIILGVLLAILIGYVLWKRLKNLESRK